MNLVADPILTPTEDEKNANRCQRTTRKREELIIIDSKLETRGVPLVLRRRGGRIKKYYISLHRL